MANELKNVFIDYATKLQEYLDAIAEGVFIVKSGKDIDVVDEDKVYVLVSYLQGGSNKDSVSLPVMLNIYCCKELQKTVVGTFIQLSKAKAQSSYTDLIEVEEGVMENAHIFEQINTPAVFNNDAQFGTNNHWTEFVGFCNILILLNIGNLKSITIDGEEIELLNGTVAYNGETITNRFTGESLNKQKIKAGTTNIQFQMVAKTSVFNKAIFDIAFGVVSKRKVFTANIELTNGYKANNIKLVVLNSNYVFNKQVPTLPSYNVVLTLADTREI